MRVALAHPFSWPAVRRGGERYLHDLAWYLTGAGHDVTVVTGAGAAGDGARTRRVPLLHHPVLRAAGLTPTETFGIGAMAALRADRHDVVHALVPAAALAGVATGHPTVYTYLGHATRAHLLGQRGALPLFRAAVGQATVVTALTRSAAAQVEEVTGRRPEVVPPGVRLDVFTPDLAPRTGPPRVLFASDASEPRKGVQFLMAAFARLLDAHPGARLVLAGPGDHRWALPGLGRDVGRVVAATDVVGPGALDDLPARYRQATVVALPAAYEAFGLVLVEALACGTPVVCSDHAGPREIVDSPAVGRVAPHGDVPALAAALVGAVSLAADGRTPAACADHARRYGWAEAVGPAHEALYRSAVDSSRAGTARP